MRPPPSSLPFLALLAACTATTDPPADPATPPNRPGLWAEFLAPEDLAASLELVAGAGFTVNLGVTRGETDWDAVETFVTAAADAGVPVVLWPELAMDEGRWPNVRNVDLFAGWWAEVLAAVADRDLPVDTLVVDMEPALQLMDELTALAAAGEVTSALALLTGRVDRALYEAARDTFATLLADAHGQGLEVRLTTLPFVLDDLADGDDDVQVLIDCPVHGLPWDAASVQAYRSVFNELAVGLVLEDGETFGPALVESYARSALDAWGEAARLDVGVISWLGYTEPQALRDDVAAARAAGLDPTRLDVYALDTLILEADPGAWVDGFAGIAAEAPPADPRAEEIRAMVQDLDLALVLE